MALLDNLFGPPKPDKYAQMFMAALRKAGDQREAHYNPQEFRIEYGDDSGITNLSNFYADYCAAPRAERDNLLSLQVRGALSHLKEMPEEFDDAKCDIYPRMWTRASLEKMRLQQWLEGQDSFNTPTQVVGDHLEASLVFDLPEAVRTISQSDLDDWGVSYYEAMEIARQNLETSNFAFAAIGDNLYASLTGDTYDGTRLLLLDLIRKLEVKGDHVAMVPNRDTLLITGSEDDVGLGMMYAFAEKALNEESRPMVPTPMRLDGDEWMDWMPTDGHSLYDQFRSLELKFLHSEYEEQKSILDAIHEKNGTDIFVASYSAIEKKDTGKLLSYCVWPQDVEALLPKTQKVVFVRGQDEMPALGRWERVIEVVGRRMERTDHYPFRFRVTEFPSDEELAAIGLEEL